MNKQRGHMSYRRSVYRKKRIKFIAITASVCIVVLSLLFLIIGNALKNKVDESITSRKDRTTQAQQDIHKEVKSVRAVPVLLSDESSSLSGRLSAAVSSGFTDICFNIDSPDGVLMYSSKIAQELGRQSENVALWKPDDAIKEFDKKELYSIGVIHIKDFISDDDLTRSASLGYYSALISEILRAGADEVLIHPGDIPTERYGELILLANEVHRLCPDMGTVGLSLPASALSGDGAGELFDKLWTAYDYLAVDITQEPDNELSISEHIDAQLGSMLYYLLRYNIRVVLPHTTDTALLEAMESAALASGAKSIQFIQ